MGFIIVIFLSPLLDSCNCDVFWRRKNRSLYFHICYISQLVRYIHHCFTSYDINRNFVRYYLVNHTLLAATRFRHIADRALPFVLIALGVYILTEAFLGQSTFSGLK